MVFNSDNINHSSPVEIPNAIAGQLRDFVAARQGNLTDWRNFYPELQAFVFQLTGQESQSLKINYMTFAIDLFWNAVSTTLPKAGQLSLLLRIADSFETLGAWDQAVEVYRAVIRQSDAPAFSSQKIQALRWIGYIELMKNRWNTALQYFRDSLEIALENGDKNGEISAYIAIGHLYFEQGAFEKVSDHWEQALALADQADEARLTALVQNNLGALANVQGKPETALAYYGESIPRLESIGQKRGLAETYHNMAMTFADLKRWTDASHYYEKSDQLAKEIGEIRLQATIYLNRVELYLNIGDTKVAEALCRRAMKIFIQLEDHLGEAEGYKLLGITHIAQKEIEKAVVFLEKSLDIARQFQNPLLAAEATFQLGMAMKQNHPPENARTYFADALSMFTELSAQKEIENTRRELDTLPA